MSKVYEELSSGTYNNPLNDPTNQDARQMTLSDLDQDVPAKKPSSPPKVFVDPIADEYWRTALVIVNKAAEFIKRDKLAINSADPRNIRIQEVIDKHYGVRGVVALREKRNELWRSYMEEVDRFNVINISRRKSFPLLNGTILLGILSSSATNKDVISKFRGRISIHIELSDPPFPLTDLARKEIRGYQGI